MHRAVLNERKSPTRGLDRAADETDVAASRSAVRRLARSIRDEVKKQTEILDEIWDDQRIEHRLNAKRRRRGDGR